VAEDSQWHPLVRFGIGAIVGLAFGLGAAEFLVPGLIAKVLLVSASTLIAALLAVLFGKRLLFLLPW
jgi:hypothetical protein